MAARMLVFVFMVCMIQPEPCMASVWRFNDAVEGSLQEKFVGDQ